MAFINACAEQEDIGGGRFRNVHHIKPAAYADRGTYKANVLAYQSKGTLAFPMVLDRAPPIAEIDIIGS